MHRYYDEEERDDELYHHGRKGQKWGQHIFSTAKNVATRAAKRAVANATPAIKMLNKHGKQGIQFLKDNPQFAYGVLAYAGSRAIQSRRRKKNLESVRNAFGNVEGAYD